MGKNTGNRDIYFDKHIRNQPTAELYLEALEKSPYRSHRRYAVGLREEFNVLQREHVANMEELLDGDTEEDQAGGV